jgi:hypothetical protein
LLAAAAHEAEDAIDQLLAHVPTGDADAVSAEHQATAALDSGLEGLAVEGLLGGLEEIKSREEAREHATAALQGLRSNIRENVTPQHLNALNEDATMAALGEWRLKLMGRQ